MGKKLAIKGHATRGNEVIELLEMLGGVALAAKGFTESHCYYISEGPVTNYISWDYIGPEEIDKYTIFTLEEFLEKYPYKVGDKVHIYVQTDDFDGMCDVKVTEITSMRWNPVMCTIAYKMKNINREFYKEEIKCKLDDDSNKTTKDMEENKVDLTLKGELYHGNRISYQIPDGYEVSKIENGEIILQKKKPKYPKTYKECRAILDNYLIGSISGYKASLLANLQKLLVCCNAYWQIAGEELGLDKPWEPDCDSGYFIPAIIYKGGFIQKVEVQYRNVILAFPTKEMRDTFYDNFKEEIENCKELL